MPYCLSQMTTRVATSRAKAQADAPYVGRYLDNTGRVDADGVAHGFDMTKPALAETLGLGRDALAREQRAMAPKSQQRLTEMLEIVGLVRDWAGNERAAMAWYRSEPIPAFGGRTAEALVKQGRATLVREYLDHLAMGGFA